MASRYYSLCNKSVGRPVAITTRDGKVHRGIITHVDRNKAYLKPIRPTRNLGGFGYGFGPGIGGFGPGFGGYGAGFGGYGFGAGGWGIALAAIAGLAFLPFFFGGGFGRGYY